jgi:E3 ubiquitin-protein ligase UBR4
MYFFLFEKGIPQINKEKTTMIILCDDGSLKIYVADSEKTEYWLQPHIQPTQPINQLKSSQVWSTTSLFNLSPDSIFNVHKKAINNNESVSIQNPIIDSSVLKNTCDGLTGANTIKSKSANKAEVSSHLSLNFPIDYFEDCTTLNDVEYGGNDLLEVYNANQLRARLSLSGNKFVVCTKPKSFKLEIRNNSASKDSNLLMGCRILCGTHSLERSPQYFEVFGRRIPVVKQLPLTRARWVDVCLTRDEAIISDNILTIIIGSSSESQQNITFIDACVCYSKSKESLG